MLTKRIIACLDMDDGRVVKGVQFVNLRDAGDPAECATAHARDGADVFFHRNSALRVAFPLTVNV